MKVGIILPSRGLIFSRTADEIVQNHKDIYSKIFFSHKRPIPECFEEPTQKALKDKTITHLWFVEDDMILPPGTLRTMLEADKAVVTLDYPINKQGRGAVFRDKGGKILFTGTGCLLVKREVFDELQAPYFRTDIQWNVKNMGDYIKLSGAKSSNIGGYGLHDVNFCMNLQRLNIPIHCVGETGQRKLFRLGKAGSNNGAHTIIEWNKVKKDHLLKQIMKWPVQPTGDLVEVTTPTGDVMVSKTHAETLVSKGLAEYPPHRDSVIDFYGAEE